MKNAASSEPVIITEHHKPSFVLLNYEEYKRLKATPDDLAEWLEMDEDIDFDIEPVRIGIEPVEL